jgi:hypothetical protein
MNTLKEYIFDRHDNYCNQKYGDNLPYSFHLNCVVSQGRKFEHLVEKYWDDCVYPALLSHDALEDARLTYNDLIDILKRYKYSYSETITDIVYCITDEKGRNRTERKNDKYYKELSENKFAVFVKLADLSANTLYSKLTGSSMYQKYKKEFPKFKEKVYIEEYKEFFDYLESL